MAGDPVCNMEVDEMTQYKSTYKGDTFYFTSAECKDRFETNPREYIFPAEGEKRGWTGAASEKGRFENRARWQAKSIFSKQKEKAAQKLGTVSETLRNSSKTLREQDQITLANYADKAAVQMDRFSQYIREKHPDEIIDEAEQYVKRRPAVFLGAAFVTGFFMARFLKSSRAA